MSDLENKVPVPDKKEGTHKDIESKEVRATAEEAKQLFREAKARLLNVNNWDKICGTTSTVFKLTDKDGQEVQELPKVGYYFKIDIPAPGTTTGEGFDWVKIEAIEEKEDLTDDSEYVVVRVRPSANPLNKNDDVAHFFSDKATSNFIVLREKKVVTAAVLGRNEVANTNVVSSLLDKIRNAFVGTGAAGGFSYPQWKSLVNGLLGKD